MNEYNDILYIPGQGGGYVPQSEVMAVELACDVQDNTGKELMKSETGIESAGADLFIFLKNENDVTRFDVDDSLMISRNGNDKFWVKVSETIEMDGHLKVNVQ